LDKPRNRFKLLCLTIFAAAFGYIEAGVVVYLRAIIYPEGFSFPLKNIPQNLLATEIYREIATLIVLFTLAMLAKHRLFKRLAFFLYAFAVWDIFYYIWLKVLINWPSSLLDWDVLFLIPCVWSSPVLSPVIISMTIIAWSQVLLFVGKKTGKPRMTGAQISLLLLSGALMLASFFWNAPVIARQQAPVSYPWAMLIAAEILSFSALYSFLKSAKATP